MSLPESSKFDPASFSGMARLFPLPNLVMFPHVLQPLHIFESRYCAMLEAALADDRLIAMAVLAPGWEKDYEGRPPVRPMACLGHIATHVALPDGRHNVLLAGVARVRLGNEVPATTLYRSAPATLCADEFPPASTAETARLTQRLLAELRNVLPGSKESQASFAQLLQGEIDLGSLTDIVAYTLELDLATKVELLAERNVYARAKQLLSHLAGPGSQSRPAFPPSFSSN